MASVNCFVATREGYFWRDDLDNQHRLEQGEEGLRPNDFRHGDWKPCGKPPPLSPPDIRSTSETPQLPSEFQDADGHSCYRFCTTDTVVSEGLLRLGSGRSTPLSPVETIEIYIGGCSHEEAMLFSATEILKRTERVTVASLCGDPEYLVMTTPKDLRFRTPGQSSADQALGHDPADGASVGNQPAGVFSDEPPEFDADVHTKLSWLGADLDAPLPEFRLGFQTSRSYPRRLFEHMRALGFRVDTFSLPWLGVKNPRTGESNDCFGVRWVRRNHDVSPATIRLRFREAAREFTQAHAVLHRAADGGALQNLNMHHHDFQQLKRLLEGSAVAAFVKDMEMAQRTYRYRMRYYRQVFWELRAYMH